ncbi:MAG: DUF3048 domain-containing protein [Lachnospiraceae bacterium]|nr:DUF3048 domain-containing protein [Lachnospiraceae bacterium]
MRKQIIAAVLVLIASIGLTACTKDTGDLLPELTPTPIESGNSNSNIAVEDQIEVGAADAAIITERPVVDGKKQSYLTGEWKDEAIVNRRPMAVMIPDNKPALPQYGISKASVYFEAPMESLGCSRIMGVFEDYDELDHIGPIRSARHYFIYEAMALDAIYCNWGLAIPYAGPFLNSDRVDNISAAVMGIDDPSDEAFARDEERKAAGYATEFTGIMTISGYEAAVARHNYRTEYSDTHQDPFPFAQDGYTVTYEDCADAVKLAPGGFTQNGANGGYGHAMAYFIYDAATHLYTRYQFGEPQIDEYNNEALTCRNVVFMITNGRFYDENKKDYLDFGMNGLNPAWVFTEGKAIPGYWTRNDVDSEPFKYYDANQEPIIFNQGKTWICLIWDQYQDLIEFE